MTTGRKIMNEARELDITEEELQLLRELRGALKDEKDRHAFMELLKESPFLLTATRKMRAGLTSYDFIKKFVLWLLASIVAVNLFSAEIGKFMGWVGHYIRP